uniref:DH domain-containing protein n=1 Tax=Strigamia maritima TaxID=126957 RepID=T1JIK5_STRMM
MNKGEQREHQRQSFRKRSDPSIPNTKSDAEDTNSGPSLHPSASSSSCSSSTRSLDSPSNSLETVLRHCSANEVSPTTAIASTHAFPRRDDSNDSDLEAEADPPNWTESVDWDIVKHLKPKERKRQEVINELFHTERTHVRNLKVLERVFYRPMVEQSLFADHIKLLFPNLEEMLEIHCQFNLLMKARTKESKIVENVSDLILEMFDGLSGEKLRQEAATFCAKQAIALEALKSKQKKDQKLAQFLCDAEGNALCRRLQLKDIIPTGMQRLTKYPLLIENLAKYTAPNTDEYANLMKAMECSKEILNHVNQMVKEAGNQHRLTDLQRKLDKSSFEKADHPIAQEFRNLDLAKYKMLHEGHLQWRINRQKSVELHVLLLENVLVLLQKQDDKYVLKFHKEETKVTHSPIIQLCNLLTRNVATDDKAFFLVSTASTVGPQIYELVAISKADRTTWLRHITVAAEAYRIKEGKAKKTENNVVATQPERSETIEENSPEKNVNVDSSSDNQEIGEDVSDQSESERSQAETPCEDLEGATAAPAPAPAPAPEVVPDVEICPVPNVAAGGSGLTSPARSPVVTTKFQRVEITQIIEAPVLIEPSEVVVCDSAVLQTAEPVLTPLEKLRRKEAVIDGHLKEKHALVAQVLHMPLTEYNNSTNACSDGERDAKDLIAIAIKQATKLSEIINKNLTVNEEDAICAGLGNLEREESKSGTWKRAQKNTNNSLHMINLSSDLNSSLTRLLSLITHREEERTWMRKELRSSREQIHRLHESRQRSSEELPTDSRPSSYAEDDEGQTPSVVDVDSKISETEAADALDPEKADKTKLELEELIKGSETDPHPPPPTLDSLPSHSVAEILEESGVDSLQLACDSELKEESNV